MAVDLLFGRVGARRPRSFKLRKNLLDGLSENEVKSRYRFGRESIQFICDLLTDDLERATSRNNALTTEEQVLVALRFFASGSFLEVVGDTVGGIPKCTVSRIVNRVSAALAKKQHQFVHWPSTAESRQETKQGFYEKGGFPGVIGCIDGTHIRIQGPSANENDFVNRKGYHSINVQAVCDHRGYFTNLVARWPGSTHDSFIFNQSLLSDQLERNHSFEDGYLLGDSGYPCKPYLITPYPNPINAKQEAFNKAHCKTRVAIEQTFGRWKRRFHLLHSECRMRPEKVCLLIGACAVLHNIAILLNDNIDDEQIPNDQPELVPYYGPDQGRLLRDHICNSFF